MSNYKFTIQKRKDISLSCFRTNTTFYRIGIQQIIYQVLFIKIDHYFCTLGRRREEYWVFFLFAGSQLLNGLLYTLSRTLFIQQGQPTNITKNIIFLKKKLFSLLWVFQNQKQHFHYILKGAPPKPGGAFCLDKGLACNIVVIKFLSTSVFFITLTQKLLDQDFWLKLRMLNNQQ